MKLLLPALFVFIVSTLHADVVLAPLFQDNAVLQRDKPIAVWGTASPGEAVTVTFNSAKVSAKADSNGNWMVKLPAQGVSSKPASLNIEGNNKITLQNILVGEVWICSGQSNMEWTVRHTNNYQEEIANGNHPLIRHFKIHRTVAETPQKNVPNDGWKVCSPKTVSQFTAVGYFFAREISQKLDIPVGIISCNWGGSLVEAWISDDCFRTSPELYKATTERWQETLAKYPAVKERYDAQYAAWEKKRDEALKNNIPFNERPPSTGPLIGPGHRNTPSGLYNGMLSPLIPYSIRGALWYQGESNVSRYDEYSALCSLMIKNWRDSFAQGDFPFYWAQLASFKAGNSMKTSWAYMREAQEKVLAVPNTGQALAIDIGDLASVHPKNKQDVGRRLALIALARDYGMPHINDSGPRFEKMSIQGNSVRIQLNNAKGLNTPSDAPVAAFELAGDDKIFHPAEAKIEGSSVILKSSQVPTPVAVRYAWRNYPDPEVNLYNSDKLPLAPFRTDNWPETP